MTQILTGITARGPLMLWLGLCLGLAWPRLADLARPAMSGAIFVLLVGTLLRVDGRHVAACVRRPATVLALTLLAAIGCPLAVGWLAHAAGGPSDLVTALVLAAASPPSAGTAALAWMLGLDGAMALTVTLAATAAAPVTVPALARSLGGIAIDPLALAGRMAALVGAAALAASLLRCWAGPRLAGQRSALDALLVAALAVFAVAAMAGMQDRLRAEPRAVLEAVALAFAVNLGQQALGALRPGGLAARASAGLILGNRNVGLVWSALGTAATPSMVLIFAAAQVPIYTLPRLFQSVLRHRRALGRPGAEPMGDPRCRTS
ncbi:hypothetical protein [Methylobacterium sp. JK268]